MFSPIYSDEKSTMSDKLHKKIKKAIEANCFDEIEDTSQPELVPVINQLMKELRDNKQLIDELKKDQFDRMQFVHILCHDLRNPIGNSDSFLEISQSEIEGEIPYYANIKNGLEYSLSIISQVEKLLAIKEGKLIVELDFFNLKECFNESLLMLKNKIEEKKITIDVTMDDNIEILINRGFAIISVFNNLISNAIKFSQEGGTIYVEATTDQTCTKLTIKDRGVGIPSSLLENLFRTDIRTNRKGTLGEKGTGFGMPLVKKFMESFEGQIEIESSEDEESHGTTVILKFWNKT
jgi:signal transduction histidine kinase